MLEDDSIRVRNLVNSVLAKYTQVQLSDVDQVKKPTDVPQDIGRTTKKEPNELSPRILQLFRQIPPVVIGIIFGGIITIGSLFIWAIINNGIGVPHPIDTPTATHVKIITPSTSLEPTLIQTEAPDPLSSLPNKYTDDFGVPMVRVPAGSFQKGNEDIRFDEQHVHIVMLDDFYIDQYEVTNALFAECFKAGVCNWEYAYATINNPDNIDHPAIYVDWETARKYCEWRGARLPTEAEWEKTARGGLEGMTHPRGNDPPSM